VNPVLVTAWLIVIAAWIYLIASGQVRF